nr:uncharacterized protein LOC111412245 [Ipomoea trifida]GMD04269.1 uncharacterized protein LOC111412245 [Ipomoea batatas]GMD06466.1 uncharacterized protein LOC111412245 [Ipomoea batatas]GMD08147.1 uncharacterized protein LOC111412245 [Ipomoea batatas]GMD34504.1 uncharacterized protein LOC111412245 [Ipomoea batatas]
MAANARMARFIMEVAPPQVVTVMRHRTSKMLDTISEEERDTPSSGGSSGSLSPKSASPPPPPSYSTSPPSPPTTTPKSKHFLSDIQRVFSVFRN